MSNFTKVVDFHKKYGVPIGEFGLTISTERAFLRARLMTEELAELIEAMQLNENYYDIAKELADVLYVVYGTAAEYGVPMDKVFAEVHRANMTKTGGKDSGGKIKKGSNYKPANVKRILK